MKKKIDFSLYFIADGALAGHRDLEKIIKGAIRGGVTAIQLREKNMGMRSFTAWAAAIKRITSDFHIPLIINDRVDAALAVGADGVHLGREDMPIRYARKLLGAGRIIGLSAHTLADAREAEEQGADYVGVGSVFPTSSKKNIRGILGIEGITAIRKKIKLSMIAIGGIDTLNISSVMQTGVDGAAVISAIINSENPRQTCELFRSVIQKYKI